MIKNSNKRYLITIKQDDYARLEQEAKKQMRSISNLSLCYILKGLKEDEDTN